MRYLVFTLTKENMLSGVFTTSTLPDTDLTEINVEFPFSFFGMRKFKNALKFGRVYYVSEESLAASVEERNKTMNPETVEKLRKNPVTIG